MFSFIQFLWSILRACASNCMEKKLLRKIQVGLNYIQGNNLDSVRANDELLDRWNFRFKSDSFSMATLSNCWKCLQSHNSLVSPTSSKVTEFDARGWEGIGLISHLRINSHFPALSRQEPTRWLDSSRGIDGQLITFLNSDFFCYFIGRYTTRLSTKFSFGFWK